MSRIVDHVTARRAALVAGVWVPLALVVAGEVAMLAIGATGPEQVVTHWGLQGADRYGPWWEFAVIVAAVDLPVLAFFAAFIWNARRFAGMGRSLAPISLGLTTMHTIGLGVGFLLFNGAPAAPGIAIGGGFAIGIAAGLVAAFALPREASQATASSSPVIPLGAGELVAWAGRVAMPAGVIIAILVVAVALLVLAVILVVTASRAAAFLFVAPTVLLVALGTTAEWRVAVGPAGATIRATFGWPRMRIPIAEIASAGVTQVDAVSDFGGWGPRWVVRNGKGRWGFVSRSGTALEIVRTDGRTVVATVDDAATAAAVLETYVSTPRR